MPAFRFSWDAFGDDAVDALAAAWGWEQAEGPARDWLGMHVKRPNPDHVRRAKNALVDSWLPKYPGAKHIVDRLIDASIGPMRAEPSQHGYVKYIRKCRNSKTLRQYLCEALLRFGDKDRDPEAGTIFDFTPRFAIVSPRAQSPDPRSPHTYQQTAWNKLSRHLGESESSEVFQGLLVMPTGSGKTYTAVHWLLSNVIASGGRVLWLAHRHELLTQAGAEFHRLSGLATGKDKLRVRIVSGEHCATTQIDPADDVIVASVHSLARRRDITERMLSDERLFVVIDEAHHAPAKSYRDIIEQLQAQKPWRVLGLTATPTRTIEEERPLLQRLFGRNIIEQVGLSSLIEQGILARPIPVRVETEAKIEEGITDEDISYYNRKAKLSEEWCDRIAGLVDRNKVIIHHYLEHKEKYGPTLIFAINVHHAALLAEQLREQGVRSDYVASYRPDETEGDPTEIIQRFRDGQLDVLVNVQIMTEGVDVPSIRTVFLTRPTVSEILLRQMVGRALRGPAAGGSERAYLVSFEDHWDKFRDWTSPLDLVPEMEVAADESTDEATRIVDRFYDNLPWQTIRAVAASMRQRSADLKADAFEAVPHGWLVIEREDEDEGIYEPISIYEHQKPCWDALQEHLASLASDSGKRLDSDALYENFFGDCDLPAPSRHHVGMLIEHAAQGGERPEYHDLEGRKACDPNEVAGVIYEGDLGRRKAREAVETAYTHLARAIYPSLREYQSAVDDALFELEHPEDATQTRRAIPIFDPRSDQQLTPGPTHDLNALMADVLEKGAELLQSPKLAYGGSLKWSKRLLKGWYGMAHLPPEPPQIRINRLLNSPDVSAETMRFLLWHEFLHIHLRQGHTTEFRRTERLWPNCDEADRELDNLNDRFGIQYW